jgi:hypothetical protein
VAQNPGVRLPAALRVGTILGSASGGRVSVKIDGATLTLPLLRGYTPTINDQVLVALQGRRGFILGALGTAPVAPPAPSVIVSPPAEDPTVAKPRTGSTVFKPTSSGSYRNGSWRGDTNDLYQGDWSGRGINTGAAFYGNGPHGLAPAVCTGVRVKLLREDGGVYGGVSPTLKLWQEKARSGAPNERRSTGGPSLSIGESSTFTLPDAWGQELIDGTAGGIGCKVAGSSPYVHLNGPTMAVVIDWRKDA